MMQLIGRFVTEKRLTHIGFVLLLSVLFCAPLVFDTNQLAPFASTKAFFIAVIALCAACIFFLRVVRRNVVTFSISSLSGLLLLFLAVLTLASVYGIDPTHSLFGSLEWSMGLIVFMSVATIALLFPIFVDTEQRVRRTIQVVFLGTVALAGTTYLDIYTNLDGSLFRYTLEGGTMGGTSFAGAYLLFGLFLGAYLFLTTQSPRAKFWYAVGTVCVLAAPVFVNVNKIGALWSFGTFPHVEKLIEAQGAFLGLVVGCVVSAGLFLLQHQRDMLRRIGKIILILLGVILVFASISFVNPNGYLHEKYIELKTPNRFVFWDIALQGVAERPLLGWGIGNYQYVYERNFNPRVLEPGYLPELWVSEPHNVLMGYVSDAGVLGLLSYLMLFLGTLYVYVRLRSKEDVRIRTLGYIVPGLLVAIFVQNLFVFDSSTSLLGFFFLIGLACSVAGLPAWRYVYRPSFTFSWLSDVRMFAALGSVACVVLLLFVVVPPVKASYALSAIISEENIAGREQKWSVLMAAPYRGNMIDAGYIADGEYDQLLRALPGAEGNPERITLLVHEIDNVLQYIEAQESTYAVRHYRASYYAVKLLSMRLYLAPDRGKEIRDRVDDHVENVLTVGPSNPKSYFVAAQVEANRGHYDEAARYLSVGLRLAPQNPEAHGLIASYLSLHEDEALRRLLIEYVYGKDAVEE